MLSRTNPLYLVHINILSMNDKRYPTLLENMRLSFLGWSNGDEETLLRTLNHLILKMAQRLDSGKIIGY
jgi:hypothetical protein